MGRWAQEDFDKIASFDAREYADWLKDSLNKWQCFTQTYLAFAPIGNRFTLSDHIEDQLADMATAMPETERKKFIDGLTLSLREVDAKAEPLIYETLQDFRKILEFRQLIKT